MLQGGPHENVIGALAAQLLQASKPEFREYIIQVKKNAAAMADELMKHGNKLVTDGTDNHLLLMNVRDRGLTGSKLEKLCDAIHITLNKNTIIGDKSAVTPGGVRIGTPAITTRGYNEADSRQVARFIDHAIRLSLDIQDKSGAKKLTDFTAAIEKNAEVHRLADEVEAFAS
jgi:glycine hydroxymethyltransferase